MISYDEIRTGGYPLALTAELVDLALRVEGKGITVQSAPIRLRDDALEPPRYHLRIPGKYGLTVTEPTPSHMTVSVESGTGEIRFNGDRREDQYDRRNLRILDDGASYPCRNSTSAASRLTKPLRRETIHSMRNMSWLGSVSLTDLVWNCSNRRSAVYNSRLAPPAPSWRSSRTARLSIGPRPVERSACVTLA